jgi:acyl carrier protein
MSAHKERIRRFIAEHVRNRDFTDEDDLFRNGYLNSLFALELVLFIEKEYSLTIGSEDLNLDNFRSVNALAGLVERKTAEAA